MTGGYVMLSFIDTFGSLLPIAGVYGVLAVLHCLAREWLISRIARSLQPTCLASNPIVRKFHIRISQSGGWADPGLG